MVKITAIALAVLATISPALVEARNCTPGLSYCGKTLYAIGNYDAQIRGAMGAKGNTNPDKYDRDNALFYCIGGDNGDIRVRTLCEGKYCADKGEGNSDVCEPWQK